MDTAAFLNVRQIITNQKQIIDVINVRYILNDHDHITARFQGTEVK